jgi:hypothetical protein
MSMAEVARVAGDAELVLLLANDQFKSWFLDEDTNRNSLEAGVSSAVSKLIEIVNIDIDELRLGESKAIKMGDVVRACEIMLKYAGYEPVRNKVIEVADRDIGKMNEAELDNFLKSKIKSVESVKKAK